MGWLTLARLYRPLYYALISNKWGKRLILAMVPYLLLLVFLPQQTLDIIPFVDRENYISNQEMTSLRKDRHYADADGFRASAVPVFIESDVVIDKVLRVHLPLRESYSEEIELMAEQDQAQGEEIKQESLYSVRDTTRSPEDST
jgi:hypothetical protein